MRGPQSIPRPGFLYPPKVDLVDDVLTGKRAQALFFQPLKGNLVGGGVYLAVDLVAPGQSLSVQVRQAVVLDPHHEIISYKLNRPLHFPLGLTSVRPAQDGLKPIESREILELPVQCGVLLLQQPFNDYLFHVIVQYLLWVSSKVPKCVLMAPNQCVCAHIRYKFDVPHPRIS